MTKTVLKGIALVALVFAAACSQPTPGQLLSRARQSLSEGKPRTASIYLKNLLRNHPDDVAARALLGRVLIWLGDPVSAEAHLRKALQLGADPVHIELPLLRALAAQGKYDDVLAQIDKGPKLTGDDGATVLQLAGFAHQALKQPQEAEQAYRAAMSMRPSSPEARINLASFLFDQGRNKEGEDLVIGVLKDEPDYAPALLLRGRLELLTSQFADAEATFRQILRKQTNGEQRFIALSQLVRTLETEGESEAARSAADELIEAYPKEPSAIVLKAGSEVEQGQLDDARARLEALVAKVPTYAPANRLLGTVNEKQGRAEQARMYFEKALTQDPSDRRTMLRLGDLQLQQGNHDGAKKLLAKALEPAKPKSDAVLFALGGRAALALGARDLAAAFFEYSGRSLTGDTEELAEVSAVYAASGEVERAQKLLRGAVEKADANAWMASYVLALVQLRQGDLPSADASLKRVAALQPKAAWPLNLRGMVALMRKDTSDARRYFAKANDLDPNYLPALLNLGRVDLSNGAPDRAAAHFRGALSIDAKQPEAMAGLAEVALSRHDFAEARKWAAQLPDSPVRVKLEGSLALAKGDFDEAAERFAELFRVAPSAETALAAYSSAARARRPDPESSLLTWISVHPRDIRVNLALGGLAMEKGDYDAAIQRYEAAIAADPKQPVALNNLAWLYERKHDDKALELARRAHQAAPDNAAIADTFGWLQVQHGDVKAALPLLRQSHVAQPESAEITYHWAAALAKTGSNNEAIDALRKALAGRVVFEGREDATRLLQELEATSER